MISCDKHDYIEIACTYRLLIELTFKDNRVLVGTANDTKLNTNREECLEILLECGNLVLLVLDRLKSMRALKTNPHFDQVSFSN